MTDTQKAGGGVNLAETLQRLFPKRPEEPAIQARLDMEALMAKHAPELRAAFARHAGATAPLATGGREHDEDLAIIADTARNAPNGLQAMRAIHRIASDALATSPTRVGDGELRSAVDHCEKRAKEIEAQTAKHGEGWWPEGVAHAKALRTLLAALRASDAGKGQ